MAQQVLTITQLNEYIRGKLDEDGLLNAVAVKGEISNYKLYPSGHHYFTLKDESSSLKCVMFKGNALRLRFRPENGMKIISMGKLSVFPRYGAYQLYCTAMAMTFMPFSGRNRSRRALPFNITHFRALPSSFRVK